MKGTSWSKLDLKYGRFITLEGQGKKAKEKESPQKGSVIFISFTLWEKKEGKPKSPKKGKQDWGGQERQISRQKLTKSERKPTVKLSAILKASYRKMQQSNQNVVHLKLTQCYTSVVPQ